MARFFFIWMIMIGSMVGIRDGAHFDVDLWPELKPRANALLRVVADVFVLVMALVFIWYGIRFVQFGWDQTSELAELPMAWIFAAWPLAGFTWVVFLGERFVANLRILRRAAREVDRMSGGGDAVARRWRRCILFGVFFFADGAARADRLRARPRLPAGDDLRAAALADDPLQRDVQVVQLVHPDGGAVLPAHRQPDERRRHHRPAGAAVARPGRPPARRRWRRSTCVLSIFFAGISGLVDRRRREPGQDLHRGAGQGRLRPVVLGRDHRGLGGARGHHPAVDPDDRLGRHAVGLDRRAVPRRHHPGPAARRGADGHGARLRQAAQLPEVPALDLQRGVRGDARSRSRR